MNELPNIPNEPQTLETFQTRLKDSEPELLAMLSNTSTNTVSWLSSIQSLLGDPGLQFAHGRRLGRI